MYVLRKLIEVMSLKCFIRTFGQKETVSCLCQSLFHASNHGLGPFFEGLPYLTLLPLF